jgi:hypothetical protein
VRQKHMICQKNSDTYIIAYFEQEVNFAEVKKVVAKRRKRDEERGHNTEQRRCPLEIEFFSEPELGEMVSGYCSAGANS